MLGVDLSKSKPAGRQFWWVGTSLTWHAGSQDWCTFSGPCMRVNQLDPPRSTWIQDGWCLVTLVRYMCLSFTCIDLVATKLFSAYSPTYGRYVARYRRSMCYSSMLFSTQIVKVCGTHQCRSVPRLSAKNQWSWIQVLGTYLYLGSFLKLSRIEIGNVIKDVELRWEPTPSFRRFFFKSWF